MEINNNANSQTQLSELGQIQHLIKGSQTDLINNEEAQYIKINKKSAKIIIVKICLAIVFVAFSVYIAKYLNKRFQNYVQNIPSFQNDRFLQILKGNIHVAFDDKRTQERWKGINFNQSFQVLRVLDQNNTMKTLQHQIRVLKNFTQTTQFQQPPINDNVNIIDYLWYFAVRQHSPNNLWVMEKVNNMGNGQDQTTIDYLEYKQFQNKYNLNQQIQQKQFCIISPYRNLVSGGYLNQLQLYMKSIQVQNYSNFQVVMMDDNSDDSSIQKIDSILKKRYPRFGQKLTLVQNSKKIGALGNRDVATRKFCKNGSIVVELDADDFLIGKQVFNILNRIYQKYTNIWFLYTNHFGLMYSDRIDSNQQLKITARLQGFNREIDEQILRSKTYRMSRLWVTSHLKSYYRQLYIKIPFSHLMQNQKYHTQSTDRFNIYSIVELASKNHIFYLDQVFYLYNFPNLGKINTCRDQLRGFLSYKSSIHKPLFPLQSLQKEAIIDDEFVIPQQLIDDYTKAKQIYQQCQRRLQEKKASKI